MPALIAVAIVAGGAAYSAHSKSKARQDAIDKQVTAVKKLKGIDIERSKTLVSDQDKAQYKDSLGFWREQNPEIAAAYQSAVENLQREAEGGAGTVSDQASNVLNTLYGEILPKDQRLEQARSLLVDSAIEDLQRGAELGPEFQAELVRAGLEEAGQSGVGLDRSGPVTSRLGTRLGEAGIQLETLRQQRATQALGAADALTTSRANVLGNLLQNTEYAREMNRNAALSAVGLGQASQVPVGLSGREVLNLDLSNLALQNKKLLELAKLQGAAKMEQVGRTADTVTAATNFAGNMISPGGGNILGGLGGAQAPAPIPQTYAGQPTYNVGYNQGGMVSRNPAASSGFF